MGKGDQRTKRGKIRRGTHGNTRLRKKRNRGEGAGGKKPAPKAG